MSIFMSIMPTPDLMDRPPESKVSPLPTSAMVPFGRPFGVQVSSTKRGGWVEPRLTPSRPPRRARLIAASSMTFTVRPLSRAIRRTRLANFGGVRLPPGSFTRSRASFTPSTTAVACSTAVRIPAAVLPTRVTFPRRSSSFVDLYPNL